MPQTLSAPPLPSTSDALQNLYLNLLRPTILPPPADFIQPLLDSFVETQDPLLESTTLFTASTRLREAGVAVDALHREFRRLESESGSEIKEGSPYTLDELRKARLRCRLQAQAGFRQDGRPRSKEEVVRKGRERMEAFEGEMKREEEEALGVFKEGLRRTVGGGA
ncbi:hypothetical protein RUND412_009922 [Rhizina undulata]